MVIHAAECDSRGTMQATGGPRDVGLRFWEMSEMCGTGKSTETEAEEGLQGAGGVGGGQRGPSAGFLWRRVQRSKIDTAMVTQL